MQRVLTYSIVAGVLAVVMAVAGPTGALACKNAGAFKHVGVVTAIDTKALTVTISDAESGEPITFAATAQQLKTIKPGAEVMIGFVEKNGKLTAVHIQS